MLKTITNRIPRDKDLPERAWTLDVRNRILDGSLYDVLQSAYHQDRQMNGQHIPEHDRMPHVRVGLAMARMVVEDSVSFLFGEGRFPTIQADDQIVRDFFRDLVKETNLQQMMRQASFEGSVGSIVIRLRILKNRVFFDTLDTRYLTPIYDPEEPDTLMRVTERFKVRGSDLRDRGYTVRDDELGAKFWFQRVFDADAETWFTPWKVGDDTAVPQVDDKLTVQHGLGFVPLVWVKNLPGGNGVDGDCIFVRATDSLIAMDYRLSGSNRALKYMSDPTLLIKSPAGDIGSMIKSADTAIIVDGDGDAKILEINGGSTSAVHEAVEKLREYALESMHGVRANPDRIAAATSGRALELLFNPMLRLADNLRSSYGEYALLQLMKLVLKAAQRLPVMVAGKLSPVIDPSTNLSLTWPPFFPPSAGEKYEQARTLSELSGSGHISREMAVKTIAANYDNENVTAELARIQSDIAEQDARAMRQSAQVQVKEEAAG